MEKEKSKLYYELQEKVITLMLGGFSFVAALAWNEAVKSLFDTFLPKNTLVAKFLYAIFVTVIIVILSKYFLKENKETASSSESFGKAHT